MYMKKKEKTIAALATPQGKGALSVFRISGEEAFTVFEKIVGEKKRFREQAERTILLYTVRDENTGIIDEVTAIKYMAPRSFTGEDMVEIICHGGPVIIKLLGEHILKNGAVGASPGEFTRRAFCNGKMDLLKAEAIKGLIDCNNSAQFESAKRAYSGKSRENLEVFKKEILEIVTAIESKIEFGEEDSVREDSQSNILPALESILQRLEIESTRAQGVKTFEQGVSVLLAGPVNAGKSSLFNKLLGYDRAIVHNRAGTTRDSISETVIIDGNVVRITDSAGMRETEDEIEKMGIERTWQEIKESNIVIWVTSAENKFGKQEIEIVERAGKNRFVVLNKIDLGDQHNKEQTLREHGINCVTASTKEGENIGHVQNKLKGTIQEMVADIQIPDFITTERHHHIVKVIVENIELAKENLAREEITAYYLKQGLQSIEEILGYTGSQEVLNTIFDKFCIGK